MSDKNLTATQIKKLAALKARGLCYVVMCGNSLVCLTHDKPADNQKRCRVGERKKK